MKRKCFISFKTENKEYKTYIQDYLDIDMIDKSLDTAIDSEDEEHIMRKIRENHLHDSTVTIHLIGKYSAESLGTEEQKFIKKELQASLYHGRGNTQNGILGVVLPEAYDQIYGGSYQCTSCGGSHNSININDNSVIKEFSYNFYIPNGKCSHTEDERFCVLVKWDDFTVDPEKYIEQAFDKRNQSISEKTRVRP
ncbi:TIR domain-containing protein [Mucilaginibacter sp.]|uniref:TIR domain-containing protein n=1 Tax=Mucilaginibacter sp. TaxID=1882438 RepID=UPI0025EAF77D|nr:TIR domain-containing protein [Mucilaginibacter sp.]